MVIQIESIMKMYLVGPIALGSTAICQFNLLDYPNKKMLLADVILDLEFLL